MSTPTYTVYRLHTSPSGTNEFTTGRSEDWTLKVDKVFFDCIEAHNYVRAQNRMHSVLPTLIVDMKNQEEKDAFVDSFCFGDNHLHLVRYFMGKPDEGKLRRLAEDAGITFITSPRKGVR